MNTRQLLSRFQHVRKISDGWMALCPAHDDVQQSLKIAEGQRGPVLHCHAGCTTQAVVESIGLRVRDLFNDEPEPGMAVNAPPPVPLSKPKGHRVYSGQIDWNIEHTYDYTDVDGTLLYQVVRKAGKKFLQRRPDGDGGWIWKVAKSVKRVPYRLPELLAQPVVWIVEGEKDADRMWALGLPATCNAGGAGKWGASEAKALNAACVERVIIIADNDDPGRKHAEDVATKCRAKGLAVTVIDALPGVGHHGDVSDWLDKGGTVDELRTLAAVPYVLPKAPAALPAGYAGSVTAPMQAPGTPAPPTPQAGAGAVELEPPGTVELPPGVPGLSDPTSYAPAHSDGSPTDVSAAQAFCDRYGDRVRFDHVRDMWFVWSGHYWKPDRTGDVWQLAVAHVKAWQAEASTALAYPKRGTLLRALQKRESRAGIDAMLTCATKLDPIRVDGTTWDREPMMFAVRNGVIDLRTGTLVPGTKEHHITQIAPFDFDPAAACPRWTQFIREIFDDDLSLMTYVHRALGYSLTADMREQAFFMCVGGGSNGKSIFMETLEHVFGDYGHRANMRLFAGDGAEKFHLAELEGRRLIVASETKPNTRINEHVLKNFTGGESQSAERKFGQPFTFRPIGKIWMGVNHEPKVADDSFGFWRRVRIVPFLRTFTGSADDRNLREKLRAEAPGILRWCVEGCMDWQEFGLPTPAIVMSATEKYQQQENPLADFFAECCTLDADEVTSTSAIIAAYSKWCDDQGIRAFDRLTRRMILDALEKQFTIINMAGINRVRGIGVRVNRLF